MYARNRDMLDYDLVSIVTERAVEAVRAEPLDDAIGVASLPGQDEAGGTKVGLVVYDRDGGEVARADPAGLASPATAPIATLLNETMRKEQHGRFILAGTRQIAVGGEQLWVRVAIEGNGLRPFLPAIKRELFDHVVLPLIPLSLMLLAFNIVVVRRTLLPLAAAVRDADALAPTQIGRRLRMPNSPAGGAFARRRHQPRTRPHGRGDPHSPGVHGQRRPRTTDPNGRASAAAGSAGIGRVRRSSFVRIRTG